MFTQRKKEIFRHKNHQYFFVKKQNLLLASSLGKNHLFFYTIHPCSLKGSKTAGGQSLRSEKNSFMAEIEPWFISKLTSCPPDIAFCLNCTALKWLSIAYQESSGFFNCKKTFQSGYLPAWSQGNYNLSTVQLS